MAENSGSNVKISPTWTAEVCFCCTAVMAKAMPVQKTDRNRTLPQPAGVRGRQGVSNSSDSTSMAAPVTSCWNTPSCRASTSGWRTACSTTRRLMP